MSIILDLDDDTAARLQQVAQTSGVSIAQLVTKMVLEGNASHIAPAAASTIPRLPPPHDFGNPPEFNYREALDRLEAEEATEFHNKFLGT